MPTPTNGILEIRGQAYGLPSGSPQIGPLQIPFSGQEATQDVSLDDNAVEIQPPATGFSMAIIIPPSANTSPIQLRAASATAGPYISPSNPTVLGLDNVNSGNSQPTWYLYSTASISGIVVLFR